ncbi:MAG: S-methyl-5-thioribose-1-phosphate isomerase [Actinomycetota bacterium]|jgi:methylthioribose-1-phosphate isomerase|nr:S-methyl-5-thioribose-1-phosphate isomerase [Actinomycetota bacterium]
MTDKDTQDSPQDDSTQSAPPTESKGADRIPRTIWWEDGSVRLIDQSRLPLVGDVLQCDTHEGVCWAIKGMAVRGAPALGVAAALGVAVWAQNEAGDIDEMQTFLDEMGKVVEAITQTRPTAVNLFWGAERMLVLAYDNRDLSLPELRALIVQEARNMVAEDEARNRQLGHHGAALLERGSKILTHCNAGSLATAFFGTALGVIFSAHEEGKIEHVWVDETRPVMQGARLTAWELMMAGVPCALITDNMAASIMLAGGVDAVIVGADRIAANGDTANKIGTYGLAVLARAHNIPFYVAAPTSTVDLTIGSGAEIPIEERDHDEVTGVTWSAVLEAPTAEETRVFDALTKEDSHEFSFGRGHKLHVSRKGGSFQFDGWARIAPMNVPVFNPAFDVTPAEFVTAIITERGVVRPDESGSYEFSLGAMCMGSGGMHELGQLT